MTRVEGAARELLVASLTGRGAQMREHERRCRGAYTQPTALRDASLRLADVYRRAAEVFESELADFLRCERGVGVPLREAPSSQVVAIPSVDSAAAVRSWLEANGHELPAPLDLDAMNRGRAAVGMPALSTNAPPAHLIAKPERPATAHCWSGAPVYCKNCGGATTDIEDEYGSLASGGSYERFSCKDCRATTYVELPD